MELYQNKSSKYNQAISKNNNKYTISPFYYFLFPFLMAEVYRVCINYSDLREHSLLERLLVKSLNAKSLSTILVGPKVPFYSTARLSDHQVLIH